MGIPDNIGKPSQAISDSSMYPQGFLYGHIAHLYLNGHSNSRKLMVTRTPKKGLQLGLSTNWLQLKVTITFLRSWIQTYAQSQTFLDEEDFLNRTARVAAKEPKKMNFFRKFGELQMLMLQHNAGLTASHPYASNPINWPFLISGISFWTHPTEQKQIYLIGNIIGWWTSTIALSIFVGIVGADLLARRRGIDPIPDRVFCFVPWYAYWLLMSLQLSGIACGITLGYSLSLGHITTSLSSSWIDNSLSITTFPLICALRLSQALFSISFLLKPSTILFQLLVESHAYDQSNTQILDQKLSSQSCCLL